MKYNLLIALIVVMVFVSSCQTGPLSIFNKCRIKQVPYTVELPVEYNVMISHLFKESSGVDGYGGGGFGGFYFKIQNTDTETGNFYATVSFTNLNGDSKTLESETLTIASQDTGEFNINYDVKFGENIQWNSVITPSLKTITRYREVSPCNETGETPN